MVVFSSNDSTIIITYLAEYLRQDMSLKSTISQLARDFLERSVLDALVPQSSSELDLRTLVNASVAPRRQLLFLGELYYST